MMIDKRVKKTTIAFLAVLSSFCLIPVLSYGKEPIPTVSWRALSDVDVSPMGRAAISLYEDDWKHAETEHFVYHFLDDDKAGIIYLKSEYYYGWIKDFFGVKKDNWKKKSHIFVFSSEEGWQAFKDRIGYSSGAAAFTNGWELYIYPSPYWLAPMMTIAHEITHIVVFRFLEGPIPLFLNEGFAEYTSVRAIAVRFRGNEYKVRKIKRIPRDEFIDVDELITMTAMPEDVAIFYNESELLIRHLVLNYGKEEFYKLALEVSRGVSFKDACRKVYGTDYRSIKKDFEDFAIAED